MVSCNFNVGDKVVAIHGPADSEETLTVLESTNGRVLVKSKDWDKAEWFKDEYFELEKDSHV